MIMHIEKMSPEHVKLWNLAVIGGASFFVFLTLRTIYRLYFHPLSKVPGPKLAAASHIVEFYYDVILGGMYCWELKRMHEKYGQIPPRTNAIIGEKYANIQQALWSESIHVKFIYLIQISTTKFMLGVIERETKTLHFPLASGCRFPLSLRCLTTIIACGERF
jgi:hypothetical protein